MVDLEARTTQDLKFTNFIPNLSILEKTFHLLNKKDHCPRGMSQCENLAHLFCHQIARVYSQNRGLVSLQATTRRSSLSPQCCFVEKGANNRPVPHHLPFGHSFGCWEGFASVQEGKCHLWGDFLPQKVFATSFWRLIFWGGETRSLDDRSESLSSLRLQNLFSKEWSTGIAPWPLISVAFSFKPSYKKWKGTWYFHCLLCVISCERPAVAGPDSALDG